MSKLSDYYAALDSVSPGWNKEKHARAVADAVSCGKSATSGNSIERMKSVITCMKGKRQYAG